MANLVPLNNQLIRFLASIGSGVESFFLTGARVSSSAKSDILASAFSLGVKSFGSEDFGITKHAFVLDDRSVGHHNVRV